ncbi:dTDP-4-dehydrorhamnose reductase [Luteibacter sp. PPL552]
MKILLLGADGQLGGYLRRSLAPLGTLRCSSRTSTDASLSCDLADSGAVTDLLRRERPALIVNAAAYTDVDRAESDGAESATAINARLPGLVGATAATWGGAVIHYSTDYVFDGQAGQPYTTDAVAAPLGIYGHSKLEGERALGATGVDHLILRTAWVYSLHGRNFLTTMLKLANERDTLSVVADQYGTPTSAGFLADATRTIATRWLHDATSRRKSVGVHHLTASGVTTWHGFATAIMEDAVACGRLASVPRVVPITSADYPTPAKRPRYGVLDTSKTDVTFGLTPPPWRADLRRVLAGDYVRSST